MSASADWTGQVGIRVPIVNAPMGGVAGGRLAAAVSRAGGLGMIGMGSAATPDALRRELAELGGWDGPFGIGLVHWVMSDQPELFEIAVAARPTLLSVSFGDDWSWVADAHATGVRVCTQVAHPTAARRAAAAGVDVLVARGAEGGGHGEPILELRMLLPEVLAAVEVPVLAAGGIGSAPAVAAALGAGAAGVWVGTAFTVCHEALTPRPARAELLAGTETELTREFDLAAGYRWPATIPERVLRGSAVNAGREIGEVRAELGAAEVVSRLTAQL
ncbi:MAG: nitronate monooxygenase [Mycolicibacterium cosmeticum]|nr:nitronate monooxygenase [Mycolicibacterium cosmeticum]